MPDEEESAGPVDLSWYYYTGVNKLGLTWDQIGRMTPRLFLRLYKHYKNTFDIELMLKLNGKTYAQAEAETSKAEAWVT